MSRLVLSCLVLSCLVLSCLVLSYLVLSYLVLSCLVISCLVILAAPSPLSERTRAETLPHIQVKCNCYDPVSHDLASTVKF
jgi:hypothetical protein